MTLTRLPGWAGNLWRFWGCSPTVLVGGSRESIVQGLCPRAVVECASKNGRRDCPGVWRISPGFRHAWNRIRSHHQFFLLESHPIARLKREKHQGRPARSTHWHHKLHPLRYGGLISAVGGIRVGELQIHRVPVEFVSTHADADTCPATPLPSGGQQSRSSTTSARCL